MQTVILVESTRPYSTVVITCRQTALQLRKLNVLVSHHVIVKEVKVGPNANMMDTTVELYLYCIPYG